MALKDKKRKVPADESFELTYIALMLLLLCFMVIMVSMAQLEGPRFRKAIGSVRGALSMLTNVDSSSMLSDEGLGVLPHRGWDLSPEEREQLLHELEEKLLTQVPEELQDMIQIEDQRNVISMTLGDLVLFEPAQAELSSEARPVLDAIANFLVYWGGGVRINGHTDNVPIGNARFPSNWDLSVARAVQVAAYLDSRGVQGNRMLALGMADSKPIVANDSNDSRARNRRVEILLEAESRRAEATPTPTELTPTPAIENRGGSQSGH